jgi:group I intron endonuclease
MYYVYSYLREDLSPYYIGKGTKGRAYASANHRINAPKDRERIYILKDNLTEQEAYDLEKLYIKMFGRVDLGDGILRNLSDGGEGPTNYKPTPEQRRKISLSRMGEKHPLYGVSPSTETREKQRQALQGRFVGEKNPMYNKTHTEENKKKISDLHKRVPKTEEQKRKMSIAAKGKKKPPGMAEKLKERAKKYKFTYKNGNIVVDSIPEFCRKTGYHSGALRKVEKGRASHHKDIIKVEEL